MVHCAHMLLSGEKKVKYFETDFAFSESKRQSKVNFFEICWEIFVT